MIMTGRIVQQVLEQQDELAKRSRNSIPHMVLSVRLRSISRSVDGNPGSRIDREVLDRQDPVVWHATEQMADSYVCRAGDAGWIEPDEPGPISWVRLLQHRWGAGRQERWCAEAFHLDRNRERSSAT